MNQNAIESHVELGERGVPVATTDDAVFIDGDVLRHRSPGVAPHLGNDRADAEALVCERAAHAAASLDPSVADREVEVIGDGVLADVLRTRFTARRDDEGAQVRGAIDTTGDPQRIVDALGSLPPNAHLVLAAWEPHPVLALDPYVDLHRTGVVLLGPSIEAADWGSVVSLPEPEPLRLNEQPNSSSWFELSS